MRCYYKGYLQGRQSRISEADIILDASYLSFDVFSNFPFKSAYFCISHLCECEQNMLKLELLFRAVFCAFYLFYSYFINFCVYKI